MPAGFAVDREEATARILATFDQTTTEERIAGAQWYWDASQHAAEIARAYPGACLSPSQVAAVIAALSPRAHWRTNLQWARAVVRARAQRKGCPNVSTGANRRAAWQIAHGAAPESVLMGPKVLAFWKAICGDRDAVCVDIWATRVATGQNFSPTRKQSAEIAAGYVSAAHARGVSPRDMQAATWVKARGRAD